MPFITAGADAFGGSRNHDDGRPDPDRVRPNYAYAGRGIGQYAVGHEPDRASPAVAPSALGRFAIVAGIVAGLPGVAAFLFGACDVFATGDSPALAQDRVFFRMQDLLAAFQHSLTPGLFDAPEVLRAVDALFAALGSQIAALTAQCASFGATAATMAAHLLHFGAL